MGLSTVKFTISEASAAKSSSITVCSVVVPETTMKSMSEGSVSNGELMSIPGCQSSFGIATRSPRIYQVNISSPRTGKAQRAGRGIVSVVLWTCETDIDVVHVPSVERAFSKKSRLVRVMHGLYATSRWELHIDSGFWCAQHTTKVSKGRAVAAKFQKSKWHGESPLEVSSSRTLFYLVRLANELQYI